jgi:hypothetical protein
MSLIIEDGSIVVNADSYQNLSTARQDAASRGLVLASDGLIAEQQLRQAYYYLTNSYESQIQGERVSAEQTGFMPRSNIFAFGFPVADNSIPVAFLKAQVSMAASINDGANVNQADTETQELASFSVDGVYSETYQDKSSSKSVLPKMPAVSQFLYPYTKSALNNGGTALYREDSRIGCY